MPPLPSLDRKILNGGSRVVAETISIRAAGCGEVIRTACYIQGAGTTKCLSPGGFQTSREARKDTGMVLGILGDLAQGKT